MGLEITGKIFKILDIQTGAKKDGSGDWEKQLFLVDTGTQYNNIYCFEIFGDQKVDNFKKFNKVGQEVTVEFNVNTSEWNGKFFTTLSAWKIMATPLQGGGQNKSSEFDPPKQNNSESDDDLPFN